MAILHGGINRTRSSPLRNGEELTDETINGKPCKAVSAGKLEVAPDTKQGI